MNRLSPAPASSAGAPAAHWRLAEQAARARLADAPDDITSMLRVALAVTAAGEPERAAPIILRLARARPDHPHPCVDVAAVLDRTPDLSRRLFRASLRLAPADERLRLGFATWLLDHDDPAEARAVLRNAQPNAEALHGMGMALAELGLFEQAADWFQRLVAAYPDLSSGWSNLGMMLKVLGRFDAAFAAHDRAVALAPGDIHLRTNRAVALLHAGRWTEAWPDYDIRLRAPDRRGLPASTLLPDLDRIEDLTGVTILATHDEGFGDTLHFMRYLPLLAARGARVLAWVPEPLLRIMSRLPGVRAFATGGPPPAHDFHIPMFSLPRAFASTPATVPAKAYLTPDPALVTAWANRLPRFGFRVGIVWAGQARPWLPGFSALDRRRSASLEAFAPLARVPGVTLVSLQAGGTETGHPRLHDPMPEVRDFADTAAIIANLDLVVSVDTSVVHLAGAMGKPVFMLDRIDNCWRWLHGRADSPWYPSLTIFRQDRPLDWSAPMQRLAAAVEALVAFNHPPATVAHPSQAREFADAA